MNTTHVVGLEPPSGLHARRAPASRPGRRAHHSVDRPFGGRATAGPEPFCGRSCRRAQRRSGWPASSPWASPLAAHALFPPARGTGPPEPPSRSGSSSRIVAGVILVLILIKRFLAGLHDHVSHGRRGRLLRSPDQPGLGLPGDARFHVRHGPDDGGRPPGPAAARARPGARGSAGWSFIPMLAPLFRDFWGPAGTSSRMIP